MIRLTLGVATCTVFLCWVLYYTAQQSPRDQLIVRTSTPSERLKVSAPQKGIAHDEGEVVATESTIPPLDMLIERGNSTMNQHDASRIIATVDFLLDFAIVGYAKTATTFVMNWLRHHPDIRMHPYEVHHLTKHDPVGMVQNLYTLQEEPRTHEQKLHYGYKAPRDIADAATMQLLSTYWPNTKVIVGVRHPVLWFQSFYNYRLLTYHELPPPATLVGPCKVDVANHDPQKLATLMQQHKGLHDRGVCTDLARFHVHLRNHLLMNDHKSNITLTRQPTFLYVDEQLGDTQHVAQLQHDLQTFLGLSTPLSNPMEYRTHLTTTASNSATATGKAFDICHSDFIALRAELLQIGQEAAAWLIDHFLPVSGVSVSCPSCVILLLETWHIDPCADAV